MLHRKAQKGGNRPAADDVFINIFIKMKIKLKPMRIFFVLLFFISGCASMSHNTVALSGTIESRREAGPSPEIASVMRPGTGGAIGGLMTGLLNGSHVSGPYHIYKIRMLNGEFIEVPAFPEMEIGSCIDVLSSENRSNIYSFWTAKELDFRPSVACRKN